MGWARFSSVYSRRATCHCGPKRMDRRTPRMPPSKKAVQRRHSTTAPQVRVASLPRSANEALLLYHKHNTPASSRIRFPCRRAVLHGSFHRSFRPVDCRMRIAIRFLPVEKDRARAYARTRFVLSFRSCPVAASRPLPSKSPRCSRRPRGCSPARSPPPPSPSCRGCSS